MDRIDTRDFYNYSIYHLAHLGRAEPTDDGIIEEVLEHIDRDMSDRGEPGSEYVKSRLLDIVNRNNPKEYKEYIIHLERQNTKLKRECARLRKLYARWRRK